MRVSMLVGKTTTGDLVTLQGISDDAGNQRQLRKDIIDADGILPDGTCLTELYLMEPSKKNRFAHKRISATRVEVEDEPPQTKPKATRKRTSRRK